MGAHVKITEHTTLNELEIERARLGIERMLLMSRPLDGHEQRCVEVSIVSNEGMVSVTGQTIHEAFDQAFRQREQQIGKLVQGHVR